ncbi:branched-chain amino acid transport system permease protein [Ferrithrix thermotolerans DSM 19514]|uniref:Branched-chain amino acid transport system permease protein n=1 Tax=Ferrithrix thermotolerans DSM 19514 TaxID=1121881 RepID=A0A1M4S7D6_9ACTN|nr:branched-chain amino acid ABC transporter permease [Ferrithrix thermotolerans]SHE28091.1 branched-chain amino acid transport system permease protein [Ferrithrix thermotolerans DSM 19514]
MSRVEVHLGKWSYKKGTYLFVALVISSALELLFKGTSSLAELFLLVTLSQSWNLIGGLTGYSSLGQVAFFGIGAYAMGVSIEYGHLSFATSLAVAAVAAVLFALVMGVPLLSLRGPYFAVATLVASLAVSEVFSWYSSVTPGGVGITITTYGTSPIMAYPSTRGFVLIYLALAVVATLSVAFVVSSPLGGALRLIRENESIARSVGVNTRLYKVAAFAASGAIAALAGGVFGFQQVALDPNLVFNPRLSLTMVAMVLIGGGGTVLGPILGAVVVTAALSVVGGHSNATQDVVVALISILGVLRHAESFPPPSGPSPQVPGSDPTTDPEFYKRSYVYIPKALRALRSGGNGG